jgi:hypothetical protein
MRLFYKKIDLRILYKSRSQLIRLLYDSKEIIPS